MLEDAAKASNKPPEMAAKIVKGQLDKWVADCTVGGQEWMMAEIEFPDTKGKKKKKKMKVADVMQQWQLHMLGQDGPSLRIDDFVRMEIGGGTTRAEKT